MRNLLQSLLLLCPLAVLAGCDEPARPRRPPADLEESADDIRDRRRAGTSDSLPEEDDRYRTPENREERRRPDFSERESTAAEEAEDDRDAAADRPTNARD